MASKKFTQFDTANNTSETEISVGVKGADNFKRANYLTATTAPTASNDGTQGYTVGSIWFNVTDSSLYVCKDSSTGAAVWSVYRERPYKLFSANLTQAGTDAPVVTVLYNDTGITWTPAYEDVGAYFLVPDTPPNPAKTQVFIGTSKARFTVGRYRIDQAIFGTQTIDGTSLNDELEETPIHILIWP